MSEGDGRLARAHVGAAHVELAGGVGAQLGDVGAGRGDARLRLGEPRLRAPASWAATEATLAVAASAVVETRSISACEMEPLCPSLSARCFSVSAFLALARASSSWATSCLISRSAEMTPDSVDDRSASAEESDVWLRVSVIETDGFSAWNTASACASTARAWATATS